MSGETEVYGFQVICEFRIEGSGEVEERRFRSKGASETKARRVPIFKRGFIRVVSLDPYTREQWMRVFGEGRM